MTSAPPPAPVEKTSRRELQLSIGELLRRLETQRQRLVYPPEEVATIERMQRTIGSQRLRLERLEHEAAAILTEITRLENELHGRQKALVLLLGNVVDNIEEALRDAWSPVPVLGYRLWAMRQGSLHGARTKWTEPTLVASCEAFGGDAPHADGRCGRLGCGIYATKELPPLLSMHVEPESHSYVAALVAMSGTVVEHERGYRAATAQVVAAYAVWPDRVLATCAPKQIAALFQACDRISSEWCAPWTNPRSPVHGLIDYLTERAKEEAVWI